MMKAPKGFTTLTVSYDPTASRKSDRVWKLTLPLSDVTIAKVTLRVDAPTTWEGSLADLIEPALEVATPLVEALGFTPEWEVKENPLTGCPVATARWIEADDAA